jgi:type IV secretory pathway component VirB8
MESENLNDSNNQSERSRMIAQKIRDGSYYADARSWYAARYLRPITDRSLLIIASIIALFIVATAAIGIYQLLPSSRQITIIIPAENSSRYMHRIQPLAEENTPPQDAIADFLIRQYVTWRETFSPDSLEQEAMKRTLRAVKNSSSKSVYTDYQDILMENISYFRRTGLSRTIDIKSLKFEEMERTSGRVIIIFEATTKQAEETKTSKWETTLQYRMPDINLLAKNPAPIRFFVNYYKARPRT